MESTKLQQITQQITQQQQEFISYVRSFYFDDDALYPMKPPETRQHVFDLILVTNLLSLDTTFEGDSFDREKARDVLIGLGYGIKWDKSKDEYTYRSL
jgi:hypothetical protein